VQPIGQLDQYYAHILRQAQHHLAQAFGVAFGAIVEGLRRVIPVVGRCCAAGREFAFDAFALAELGDRVHQPGDFIAELGADVIYGDRCVLSYVVQQRGGDGGRVELGLSKDTGDGQGM